MSYITGVVVYCLPKKHTHYDPHQYPEQRNVIR